MSHRLATYGSVGICCIALLGSGCATEVNRAAAGIPSASGESASTSTSMSPAQASSPSGSPLTATNVPTVKLTFTNSLKDPDNQRRPELKWEVTNSIGEFIEPKPSDESPAGLNNLVQLRWAEPASVIAGLKPGQQGGRFTIRPSIADVSRFNVTGGWSPLAPMTIEYDPNMGWYTALPNGGWGCTATRQYPILRKSIGVDGFWYWLTIQCTAGRINFEISDAYI